MSDREIKALKRDLRAKIKRVEAALDAVTRLKAEWQHRIAKLEASGQIKDVNSPFYEMVRVN